jgi:hypothetical protein
MARRGLIALARGIVPRGEGDDAMDRRVGFWTEGLG